MVYVTLPPQESRPELYQAIQLLARSKQPVGVVCKVYASGDPEAALDDEGIARQTILFLTLDGEPRTALLGPDEKCPVELVREGWVG